MCEQQDYITSLPEIQATLKKKEVRMRVNFALAREKAGLSIAEAAQRLGITPAAIYQWESGDTFPDGRRLPEIARVYGTSVDDLLKETDDGLRKT